MNVRVLSISAAFACAAFTGEAHAAIFDFSYSFPTTDTTDFPSGQTSASGMFTATNLMDGSFLVTNVSGSWNGEAITGVSAPNTEGGNDNLIFPKSSPVLDENGVTFSVAGPIKGDLGDGVVNIYYSTGSVGYTDLARPTGFSPTFNLTEVSSAPEPSTWALMIVGAGLVGAALRRRLGQLMAAAA